MNANKKSCTLAEVAEIIKKPKRILLATHINPDGDAIGSISGMGYLLLALGKDVRLYCPSNMPEHYTWLTLPSKLQNSLSNLNGWEPELLITLDCGDASRTGPELAPFWGQTQNTSGDNSENAAAAQTPAFNAWKDIPSLCIDHHRGNPEFATGNWVEPNLAATAEMVGRLVEHCKISLSGPLGESLYLGIVSDSGNFSYGNTTPALFGLAARILEAGLNIADFNEKNNNTWSMSRMRLWASLINGLRQYADGRILLTVVTQAEYQKHGATSEDLEGFVSWIRSIRGTQVAVLVTERKNGKSKVSLRSVGGANSLDIRNVAAHFGGGGHTNAAGVEISLPVEEAASAVVEYLVQTLF